MSTLIGRLPRQELRSCMTEDQKYQGALYKDTTNKNKKARLNPPNRAEEESNNLFHTPGAPTTTAGSVDRHNHNKQQALSTPSAKPNMAAVAQYQIHHHMSHAAYVEDVPDVIGAYLVADDDDNRSDDNAPPHAPTPPPVSDGTAGAYCVFDFLDSNATPNASDLALPPGAVKIADGGELDVNAYLAAPDDFSMAGQISYQQNVAKFGSDIPTSTSLALSSLQTPAPVDRAARKKKESSDKDKDASKKDKKRKRLYVDVNDQVMTDAPPVLHSGLTGGLKSMMTKRATFPPSPQSAETPGSPLKHSKHSKHSKQSKHSKSSLSVEPVTNGLFSKLVAKPKTEKRKHRQSSSPLSKRHKSSSRKHHRDSSKSDKKAADKSRKLLEYSGAGAEEDDRADAGQLIVYKPRADLFLSFVNKGPDSERGCSMNKALKRFHRERERSASGTTLAKPLEEKELFRSLRLRKNDRGEIVLFCVDDE
ncbi:hypothetical protein SEPCBS119000_002428 [Sporothrix epigloea]|uniref:Uncharacterized protein n=1 Tax=Sporothrix epigloea TaxID=1892477 RepID=A0ABP0DG46_9PEZI